MGEHGDAFGWLRLVKSVSDLTNDSFTRVWEYTVHEFFTYVLFRRKLAQEEKEMINKLKQRQ